MKIKLIIDYSITKFIEGHTLEIELNNLEFEKINKCIQDNKTTEFSKLEEEIISLIDESYIYSILKKNIPEDYEAEDLCIYLAKDCGIEFNRCCEKYLSSDFKFCPNCGCKIG